MPAPKNNLSSIKQLSASDFADTFADISNDITAVKNCIANELVTSVDEVDERLAHVVSASGKMLRPALVLLSGKMCGETNDQHIRIGAIIEMMHIATLLHDDVIDQAEHRRSLPTPNHLWGNESAVLLGDFLLSKAFAMAAEITDREVAKILAETAISICKGEVTQNANRNNWHLTEEKYFEIIEAKTASLFSTCCGLGARACKADPATIEKLCKFGLNTGIAFQIADDLIDITGGKSEGKTLGRDLADSKATLPLIHLLSTLKDEQADELIKKLSSGKPPADYEQILIDAGSIDYCKKLAKSYCEKAMAEIDNIGTKDKPNHLKNITQLVIQRCG